MFYHTGSLFQLLNHTSLAIAKLIIKKKLDIQPGVIKHLKFLLVGGVSRGQVLQLINGDPNVTEKKRHL